ncbi:MAG: DUF302 domain-containing protein [Halodesulfurarchaeum sp.]
MTYTLQTTVDAPFEEILDAVTTQLGDEGFGVLSDIDVQATFEKKLDVERGKYRILGTCNPPLAHEGISAEPDLGALLPCNVVIYETDDGGVVVGAADPETLLEVTGNPELDPIASEVKARLERVITAVEAEFPAA